MRERLGQAGLLVAFVLVFCEVAHKSTESTCPSNATEVAAMVGGKPEEWRQVPVGFSSHWELISETLQQLRKPEVGKLSVYGDNLSDVKYAEYRCPLPPPYTFR